MPIKEALKTVGALWLRVAAGSRAYALGLESGDIKGDDGTEPGRPPDRGLGRSWGDALPFCLVRFICKHRSG